jgi:hypothetical protein
VPDDHTPSVPSVYHPPPPPAIPVYFGLAVVETPPWGEARYRDVAVERFTARLEELDGLRRALRCWALTALTPREHPMGLYIATFAQLDHDDGPDEEPYPGVGFREEPICWDGEHEIPLAGDDIPGEDHLLAP